MFMLAIRGLWNLLLTLHRFLLPRFRQLPLQPIYPTSQSVLSRVRSYYIDTSLSPLRHLHKRSHHFPKREPYGKDRWQNLLRDSAFEIHSHHFMKISRPTTTLHRRPSRKNASRKSLHRSLSPQPTRQSLFLASPDGEQSRESWRRMRARDWAVPSWMEMRGIW